MRCIRASSRFPRIALPMLASASLIAAGCAGLDPHGVGTGKYMQYLEGGAVVTEMETAISGMLNCAEQAHARIRETPNLAGRLKCAGSPTSEPLAFSLLIRSTQGRLEGYQDAAPYRIRTSTGARCRAILNSAKADGKTAIIEDKCGP
jgi:hypothetical protein